MSDDLQAFAVHALERGGALTDSPLQTTVVTRVHADPANVWAYLTDFDRLHEWVPFVRRSHADNTGAERPGEVGAVRVMESPPAKPTRETVVAFEAPRLLAYSAADANLMGMFTRHLSVLSVESHPEGGTVFTWLAYGVPARNAVIRFIAARVFAFVLRRGSKTLTRRLGRRPAQGA